MMLEFTVGINIAGKHESVTVAAEDALIAALKVKCERPDAMINYVRRRNRRGDLHHPHGSIAAGASSGGAAGWPCRPLFSTAPSTQRMVERSTPYWCARWPRIQTAAVCV